MTDMLFDDSDAGSTSGLPDSHPVILFDGVCNLCHALVRWVIRHDPQGIFKFASLQSATADQLLKKNGVGTAPDRDPSGSKRHPSPDPSLSTMFLIDPGSNNRLWAKSDAWLEIVKRLAAPWSWLGILGILPRGLRDAVYDFIANHRYRWFGKKQTCPLPDPKLKNRFLS